MIERRAEHHPMAQPVCGWCRCFPCQCARSQPCVCGGTVTVDGGFVAAGVRAHQGSPEHVAWRQMRDNGSYDGVSVEPNRLPAAAVASLLTPGDDGRAASGSKTDA